MAVVVSYALEPAVVPEAPIAACCVITEYAALGTPFDAAEATVTA